MQTLAIAPCFANSKIRLTVSAMIADPFISSVAHHTLALFKDAGADAIAASLTHKEDGSNVNTDESSSYGIFILDAIDTDPRTDKVTMGPSAGTLYVNRRARSPAPTSPARFRRC